MHLTIRSLVHNAERRRSVKRPRFNWIFFLPKLADILFLDKGVVLLITPALWTTGTMLTLEELAVL